MDSEPLVLPICTVQPDFLSVIADIRGGLVPEETFWLSCYKSGEPSVHGKVYATLDEVNRDSVRYDGRDGVQLLHSGEALYSASCASLQILPTRLAMPTKAYSENEGRKATKITAFDVSPDGSQFATGHMDGSVHISQTLQSRPIESCRPHVSTVTSLRFFPSSRVLLTASSDFSLSILPAAPSDDPSAASVPITPARRFYGHTRGITSTAIVSKGRNLLSSANDGTVRLWDVPSESQIRTIDSSNGSCVPVLAISIGEETLQTDANTAEETEAGVDPREVDTEDKVVFAALQDGTFEALDLRTKRSVFQSQAPPGRGKNILQAITYAPTENLVATGSTNGVVSVYDTRVLSTPLTTFKRNTASIEDLAFVPLDPSSFVTDSGAGARAGVGDGSGVGLAIATEDGLPYVADVRPEGPGVRAELIGSDCDAVRAVRVVQIQEPEVWTAADDGAVRRYRVRSYDVNRKRRIGEVRVTILTTILTTIPPPEALQRSEAVQSTRRFSLLICVAGTPLYCLRQPRVCFA
ncbi:WD40 repeat-like protein [Daedalea quercina L-15889]|uniref:WD40 repeat-like protein n=1 Tax=Daedalea quercina L-15889 TaxID=1314783 RepID=A0A165KW33_9APHY|nr:WD40 repeat-like protein [Daedalea quercina L-15889]